MAEFKERAAEFLAELGYLTRKYKIVLRSGDHGFDMHEYESTKKVAVYIPAHRSVDQWTDVRVDD